MNATLTPMITVILTTYRRPQLLKRAIHSVLKQTYPHFQICVYDNASGDETASVVAELAKADPRVKYYCHPQNIGAFNNFQFGLKRVETPLFSFLADDDFVLPEFYEIAVAGFNSHPEAMCSVTDVIQLGMHNNILSMALETSTPRFHYPPEGLRELLEHRYGLWTGALFRKEITEVVGLLDRETGMFSDHDFAFRIAARCPFVVSKHPGAVFNLSMSQARAPYLFDWRWPGVLKMIRNLTDDESLPPDVRTYAERVLLGRFKKGLFESGIHYLSRGYPADARKVAALLRDQFRRRVQSVVLSAIINTHQYVPFARLAFDSLIACRRHVHAKRVRNNQERYREYRHFLAASGLGEDTRVKVGA